MSLRIDATEWISGALLIGEAGLGVLGSVISANSEAAIAAGSRAGYLYSGLTLPNDANKEVCGRITSWPTAGILTAYEDGSFSFTGAADDSYSFTYQLYEDGVAKGVPATVALLVGIAGPEVNALSAQGATSGAPTLSQPVLTAAASFDNLAAQDVAAGPPTISPTSIAQIHVLMGRVVVTGGVTVTRAVLVGDLPDYMPSIYAVSSPVTSYSVTVPVPSYSA